jgi:hypothetical protein
VLNHTDNDQGAHAMSTFSQPIDRAAKAIDRPVTAAATGGGEAPSKPDSAIASIVLDVVIPLGIYYLLHDALGLSLVTSMACSSILPAGRTIVTAVRDHALETLATLMLTTNLASIAVSLASGDARLLFAREAAVSSVIAVWALGTVGLHRTPLFEPGFEAFMTRGERRRAEIWRRLRSSDPEFGALLRRHTLVWGVVLLADSGARVMLALTMPVGDLPWLSTAVTGGSVAVAVIASGAIAGARVVHLYERAYRPLASGSRSD